MRIDLFYIPEGNFTVKKQDYTKGILEDMLKPVSVKGVKVYVCFLFRFVLPTENIDR